MDEPSKVNFFQRSRVRTWVMTSYGSNTKRYRIMKKHNIMLFMTDKTKFKILWSNLTNKMMQLIKHTTEDIIQIVR